MTRRYDSLSAQERFSLTVAALVGKTPPVEYVINWLENREGEHGIWELQDWVGDNMPNDLQWTQAIAILDAAQALAENPEEGVGHEPWTYS